MAASVRFTALTVDRYSVLGPGTYTLHFPDRMSCLPIPTVLKVIIVNIWLTTIFVVLAIETASAAVQRAI